MLDSKVYTQTYTHTHIHTEYVILTAFPRQNSICDRTSVLHLYCIVTFRFFWNPHINEQYVVQRWW